MKIKFYQTFAHLTKEKINNNYYILSIRDHQIITHKYIIKIYY